MTVVLRETSETKAQDGGARHPHEGDMLDLSRLNFEKGGGLVTVVAQDARSGAVLMVAHADKEALEKTIATGQMHYRSRSRGLWHKGETSGNTQAVVSLEPDCDGDAVLARVRPAGPGVSPRDILLLRDHGRGGGHARAAGRDHRRARRTGGGERGQAELNPPPAR